MAYGAGSYGPNPNAGVNVNADHGWGGYQYPNGVPSGLLGTATYGPIRVTIRRELVELASLAFAIAKEKHGYTVWTRNPNGNGENWGPWGYENRTISGSSTPSNHSKGKAMDWNAPNNGYANGFASISSDFPPAMVRDLESIGWCWGGRYGDAMHWEYGYSPADVAGHVAKAKGILIGAGAGSGIGSIGDVVKTPDQLEEEELMGVKDDILAAVAASEKRQTDAITAAVNAARADISSKIGGVITAASVHGYSVEQILTAIAMSVDAKVKWPTADAPKPPAAARTHKVVSGDTFSAIAKKYGVTDDQLAAANPAVKDRNSIEIDQVLTIPKA